MWKAGTIFFASWVLMMTFSTNADKVVSAVLRDNATIMCASFAITETSWYGPDASGQRIRYTSQGQTLILNSVPRRNRLQVKVVTLSSNISSLIIVNAMKTDAGTYACNNGKDDYNFIVQVTDPNATLYVTEGTQSVLTCPLRSVINSLQWSGSPGATVYNIRGSTTLNIKGLPARFVTRLAMDPTTGALIINNTQRSDDDLYKCNVGGPINYVQLKVLVSPRNPVITNTTEDIGTGRRVVWATEDSQIALVCQVRGGNPESSVKWLRGGLTSSQLPVSNSTQRNADGTYDITSIVIVMARRTEDRVTYVCQAEHRTWTSPHNDSMELYLRLKPSELLMSDPGNLHENATLSLTCMVSRCRPAATITWSGAGTFVTDNIEDKATETFNITSTYSMTVTRQDNGATLQCIITHPALSSSLVTSKILTVWFSPINVSITNNKEVTAGIDKLILRCTTGTSNPIADIIWMNGTNLPAGIVSSSEDMDGAYGGKVRNQDLTIIPTHYMDTSNITCKAQNSANTRPSVSASVILKVKSPPVILKIPKNVAGGIGSIIAIQLDYYSNTDAGHVTLQNANASKVYKGDSVEEIQTNNLPVYTHYVPTKVYRGFFNISINSHEDYGNYTINVTNTIGFAIDSLEIKPDELEEHQTTGPQRITAIGGAVGALPALAVIIVLILLLRRRASLSEQNMDREHTQRSAVTEGTNMEGYTTINTVASTGGENDTNPYLNLQDIAGETNESVNIRSYDTVTYEPLHPYANVKEDAYSSLNPRPHQKREEGVYENLNTSDCH